MKCPPYVCINSGESILPIPIPSDKKDVVNILLANNLPKKQNA